MNETLRRLVRQRANGRCEYCRLSQHSSVLPFHIEHVIPRQHGGLTIAENLALSCPHCNLHKGPNLTGIDPDSGELCRLFHPRLHVWAEHFRSEGARIAGLTPIGRVTVWVLDLNAEHEVGLRERDAVD